MHVSTWMVLAAALLPYVTLGFAKASPSYDNASPRVYLDGLHGWRARADWAHRNHFEAFAPFAAGVILAQLHGAPQSRIDLLATLFIGLRVVYTGLYLANLATLRSVVWSVGVVCVVLLYVQAAR